MKSSRLYPSFLLAAAIALMLFPVSRAADATTSTIKFSDPGKPGTLKIQLARGDLRIKGVDTAEISVESEVQPITRKARKDGLRVLSSSSGFTLTEKDNVVTLDSLSETGHFGGRADFNVSVPRNTNVVVQSSWGGGIDIAGVAGDLDITCTNGVVTLDGISGGAVVNSMNGQIRASVQQLQDNRPLSFTSMNGEVLLRVPADAKANLRLRTHNGSILTDFEETALVTKTENAPAAGPGRRIVSRSHGSTVLPPEAHEAIREASRAAVEVTREAAQALREAANAAREGAEAARIGDDERGPTPRPARAPEAQRTPRPPTPPIPPVTGGKLVTGTLNGGGPEINVATMNGDVTLRRLERK
ncbi:MAG: DUF4097 family beta strand repeat-containing protein [Opitutaceae bacterium]|nr:DUF4097 family beta strand repeat-containing protein [Opitutaceae bacterium]